MKLLILSLAGCLPCAEGWEPVDGHCQPDNGDFVPVELDDNGHPPCELLTPGGRLELELGCADGVCDGDPYEAITDVLGPGVCEGSDVVAETSFCEWSSGVHAHFDDQDLDGRPDDGAPARGLFLYLPWNGADAAGLGLGVSLACFYETLGEPAETDRISSGDNERVVGLTYTEGLGTVFVHDVDGLASPDGIVSQLSLFAP